MIIKTQHPGDTNQLNEVFACFPIREITIKEQNPLKKNLKKISYFISHPTN